MQIDLLSIFPEFFDVLNLSLLGKAQDKGLLTIEALDVRKYSTDAHHTVDDTPYGGGAGMVMMAEPWGLSIDEARSKSNAHVSDLIILTPAGKKFDQEMAMELSKRDHLIFACGRYEGIDHRINDYYSHQDNFNVREISIGDYVLNGGEVAAVAIVEAVARLIPGVIGNSDSLRDESHSIVNGEDVLLEYPNYTKPAQWRGLSVPEVLLSGNHGAIDKWRLEQAKKRTDAQRGI
jgi:tRNA (guanine37-N1)-methyltransferase